METKLFTFRLDKETRDALEQLAACEGRTKAGMIKRLIHEAARKNEGEPTATDSQLARTLSTLRVRP